MLPKITAIFVHASKPSPHIIYTYYYPSELTITMCEYGVSSSSSCSSSSSNNSSSSSSSNNKPTQP